MNKKGFTLIELLAVISILALIAVIVFPAINSVVRSSRESAYNEQISIVENAAKEWGLDNVDILPETGSIEVSVDTLKNDGYIAEEDVLDPRDNEPLKGSVRITYESHQYTYEYIDK